MTEQQQPDTQLPALTPWRVTEISEPQTTAYSGAVTITLTVAPPVDDTAGAKTKEAARTRAFTPLGVGVRERYLQSGQHRSYHRLRAKLSDCERDLQKLRNALDRIGPDRSDLMLGSLSGEKLAAKLGKLESQEQDLQRRLQEAQRGREILTDEVAQARVAAEEHLARLLNGAVWGRDREVRQQVEAAKRRFIEVMHERLGAELAELAGWLLAPATVGVGGFQRAAVAGLIDEAPIDPPAEPATEPEAPVVVDGDATEAGEAELIAAAAAS
jgi:hypothetical protein